MHMSSPALAPQWPGSTAAPALVDEARATTRSVARTFSLACRLLPRSVRDDVCLLYLVFRTLDDLVDEHRPEAEERVAAVAAWAEGAPGPVTREVDVLERLATRHPLPPEALSEFCAGMRQDLARETFATEADVDRYCFRVAGTVGLVMTSVLGTSDPARANPAAAALGMAMQRTNLLRDIDEDAARGRIYLAREALVRHGHAVPGSREALLREQIARADALYDEGLPGTRLLLCGGRAVAAAGGMYREILRQLERDGLGAHAGRSVVSPARKALVGARAALRG